MNIEIISKRLGWIAFWCILAASFPINLTGFFRLELQEIGLQANAWPGTWLLGIKMIFCAALMSCVVSAFFGFLMWIFSKMGLGLISRLDPGSQILKISKS